MDQLASEVYPSAPLMYVAVEVRFPHTPRLASDAALPMVHDPLRETYPIVAPGMEATVVVGANSPPMQLPVYRFIARDKTSSVHLTPTSVVLDTTDYVSYPEFRAEFGRVLSAIHDAVGLLGVVRLGLRYVDEIRLQSDEVPIDAWKEYVAGELVEVHKFAVGGYEPVASQGIIEYRSDPQFHLVLRHGPRTGRTVGDSPLRRRGVVRAGSYFLLDMDSYWADDEGSLRDFDAEWVLATCDRLHDPARMTFEAAITDKLRDEILRVET
jgi:uncharacterized protein (TIGR04255 family)